MIHVNKLVKKLSEFGLGLIVVVLMLSPDVTHAAIYYVATTGNNSNPGSQTQPFRTINKGFSVLSAGDTLEIKGGTYPESIHLTGGFPTGNSWSNPVTIKAADGETVTVRPNVAGEWQVFNFGSSGVQYIIMDGLIIDAVKTRQGVNIHSGAHHIRLQNVEIKNATEQGIIIVGQYTGISDYNEFLNMNVHNNGTTNKDHGIYMATNNNLVENGEWYDNAGYGIHLFNGYGLQANDNIIRSNRVHGNGWAGGGGIILSSGLRNSAYNNIVWDNIHGMSVAYNGVADTKLYNNTVYDNKGGKGIRIRPGSTNTTVMNNIVYANGTDILDEANNSTISNNLTTNPNFTNASAQDFSLKDGSAAIDAGMTIAAVTLDISGTPRPQGNSYDIGAYEYQTGPISQPEAVSNLRILPPN